MLDHSPNRPPINGFYSLAYEWRFTCDLQSSRSVKFPKQIFLNWPIKMKRCFAVLQSMHDEQESGII